MAVPLLGDALRALVYAQEGADAVPGAVVVIQAFIPQELARGADGAMTGFAYPEMLVAVVAALLDQGIVDFQWIVIGFVSRTRPATVMDELLVLIFTWALPRQGSESRLQT